MSLTLASRAPWATLSTSRSVCVALLCVSMLAGCAGHRRRSASTAANGHAADEAGHSTTVVTVIHEGTRATRSYVSDTQEASDDSFLWGGSDIPVGPTGFDHAAVASAAAPARPDAPPAAPPKMPDDGVFVEGAASRYQVQAALEDSRAELLACIPHLAGEAPEGSVIAAFKLDRAGVVRRVDLRKSTFSDPAVEPCIARVLRGLRVPEARGRETSVVYPLQFGSPRMRSASAR